MIIKNTVLSHIYLDSIVLMELSAHLLSRPGVDNAAVMMGTPANLALMTESGLLCETKNMIVQDDLIVAVAGEDEGKVTEAILWVENQLKSGNKKASGLGGSGRGYHAAGHWTWRNADEDDRMAVISVPGAFAAAEARKAMKSGRHVFLFSDHVSIEDEVELKKEAKARDLLFMGPECGTSIISGIPLGFANVVRNGPVGLVAASGSGLQEVVCLIDRLGSGITHAIGTGGRDLSLAVGGESMLQGIDLLLSNEATKVLVLISKPPDPYIIERIISRVKAARVPVVICFLGSTGQNRVDGKLHYVHTLEEAALEAVRLTGKPVALNTDAIPAVETKSGGLIRGLFSGGTLCYEAMVVLRDIIGPVWSNKPLDQAYLLKKGEAASVHMCLDLGAEEFTLGIPHPMIDSSARANMLIEQAANPLTGIFLLDFVLGYGSNSDPVGAMTPAILKAQSIARSKGRNLIFIASVTGTTSDPQTYEDQVRKLNGQGVVVAQSNAAAARMAGEMISDTYIDKRQRSENVHQG